MAAATNFDYVVDSAETRQNCETCRALVPAFLMPFHMAWHDDVRGRTRHGMMPSRPNPEGIALHDEVARAVRLGDCGGAERAMRAIIEEAAAALRHEYVD